jgi:hypothetical protein
VITGAEEAIAMLCAAGGVTSRPKAVAVIANVIVPATVPVCNARDALAEPDAVAEKEAEVLPGAIVKVAVVPPVEN